MPDRNFISAAAILFSGLYFALSTYLTDNMDMLIRPTNDLYAVLIAIAIGSGLIIFPNVILFIGGMALLDKFNR